MDRLEFKPGDATRTVFIPTHTVNATDFDMPPEVRDMLVNEGRAATVDFLSDVPPQVSFALPATADAVASVLKRVGDAPSRLTGITSFFSRSRRRALDLMSRAKKTTTTTPTTTTPTTTAVGSTSTTPVTTTAAVGVADALVVDKKPSADSPADEPAATRRSYCSIM
eukprot:EC716449.1.p1 GENE.EC716449.1~~EC716449.1.p1  ORF type:complete len:187 (+),score=57.43 EC716449.1:62-562(+)